MVSQKNIKAWLPLSAVLLVSIAILGMAVHASTANTDKRARESCSSTAHKQFHTDAKKATKEWWDQAGSKDEQGHQKLLKELKKQHKVFHKAMRGKKSCPSLSLPVKSNMSSTAALPSSRSGSTLPTTGSPAKRAAPSPSPAVPSVSVPSPSGNGSPSPSVPVPAPPPTPFPIISLSASSVTVSSSNASGSSLSRVSSVSSSGATRSATSSVAAEAPSISGITVRNITLDSATIEWTTNQSVAGRMHWGDDPSYGRGFDGPIGFTHSTTLRSLLPGTAYYFEVFIRDENWKIVAKSPPQTFQTLSVDWTPGNTTLKAYHVVWGLSGEYRYFLDLADPDTIQRYSITTANGSSLGGGGIGCVKQHMGMLNQAPTDFPITATVQDCAGNWSKVTVAIPPSVVVEKPGNTTFKINRLSDDTTKYTLTLTNPSKLMSLIIRTARGAYIWYTNGPSIADPISSSMFDPICTLSSITSSTVTLDPADFPLTAGVSNCDDGVSEVTAEVSPQ